MKSYQFVDGFYRKEIEIKRSRFIASIKGEVDEDEAIKFVNQIKKEFPDATHNCYAYIADEIGNIMRFSDDGEPSGTAGQPMLEALKKSNLKKTAVVVTRYFGGVKLGASGLVGAYTKAVIEGLIDSNIKEMQVAQSFNLLFSFSDFAISESLLGRYGEIKNITYGDGVKIEFYTKLDLVERFLSDINSKTSGRVKIEDNGQNFFGFKN